MKPRIIFNKSAAKYILSALGISINSDGTLSNETHKQIKYPDGDVATIDNFSGIMKGMNGETVLLKDDLLTIMSLLK